MLNIWGRIVSSFPETAIPIKVWRSVGKLNHVGWNYDQFCRFWIKLVHCATNQACKSVCAALGFLCLVKLTKLTVSDKRNCLERWWTWKSMLMREVAQGEACDVSPVAMFGLNNSSCSQRWSPRQSNFHGQESLKLIIMKLSRSQVAVYDSDLHFHTCLKLGCVVNRFEREPHQRNPYLN